MSIPWQSLKKVHDILVRKADGFFAAGRKVPHVLFLIRVDTESGAITNCEIADQRTAAYCAPGAAGCRATRGWKGIWGQYQDAPGCTRGQLFSLPSATFDDTSAE